MKRTNYNGILSLADVNKEVTLVGWVAKRRNLGSLLFIDLRDTTGIVQVTVREGISCPDIRNEYVIQVIGSVAKKDVPNKLLKTGEIEVIAKEINVINKAETTPMIIDDNTDALEDTRLKYRYLDLRSMSFIGDKYDYAWHFSDSLAAVMLDEKIGFVDYSGTFSIPCQFPCEDWLIKNHNMLAFKDGFCPVMNEESNYYPIGKDGSGYANERFDSTFAFPYWRNCDEGMIILSNGLWNATDINGLIQEKLPFEFDDVIRDQPIYRHLVVNESDVLEKLPDIDISGVWWCETMESYVYFGKYDSCCVGADAFHFNGKYFIQQSLMEKTLIFSDDADFYDFTISDYSDGYLELLESDGDKLIFYRQREL